ncbi:NAD-dependent epimerase/dehydratase family protein [Nonomuraea thailandensis]
MHVFVTGGTGTIGSAVVAELLNNGHTVLALARSDRSAQTLTDAGAQVLRGQLADLDVLRAGAARSGGVISLAFGSDYSTDEAVARSIAEEGAALAALGEELLGSDRPIVTVSGTPWVPGRPPPRPTRRRSRDRWAVAAVRSTPCWIWPHAACAVWPYACRARCTTRAGAVSPAC